MTSTHVFFIHGFLGLPRDWGGVLSFLNLPEGTRVTCVNLWDYLRTEQAPSFESWARDFNQQKSISTSERNILVGYSLGGRLAMMALMDNPSLWSRVFLISANLSYDDVWIPGEPLSSEREERRLHDLKWSERFFKDNWEQVLKAWNSQAVFSGSKQEPQRLLQDYDRLLVAKSLTVWTQAFHQNMRQVVTTHVQKIRVMVGESDQKYSAQWSEFKSKCDAVSLLILANAGHRILFDRPEAVAQWIEKNY